jgi:anaerobic ribonucleoside-triphosphate reductase
MCDCYEKWDTILQRNFLPQLVIPVDANFCQQNQELWLRICKIALSMRKFIFNFSPSYLGIWPKSLEITSCLDKISVNLVQAAYKAGKENKFWKELEGVMGLVVKAHLDKRRFFINLGEFPLSCLEANLYSPEKMACFVEIIGLPEAIFFLTGQEMTKEIGWKMASQIFLWLQNFTQQVWKQHGVQMKIVDSFANPAMSKFVRMDQEIFPELKNFFPEAMYTQGPHFRMNSSLSLREKIVKESELQQFIPAVLSLMPEIKPEELFSLLVFSSNAKALALRIC